jgi:hypothetical protein
LSNLSNLDCSQLWIPEFERSVNGIIGDNFQRIRIRIISVKKKSENTYEVTGKSMVKNNICQFKGEIIITNARVYKEMHYGVDDEYKDKGLKKQGLLVAEYHFYEDSIQLYSGKFEGILCSSWYIDKSGQIHLDDIESFSDSYNNNEFVGIWKSYKTNASKICNWGDYRIPLSGDFDIGDGEFMPNDKYIKNGWHGYVEAYRKGVKEDDFWWK